MRRAVRIFVSFPRSFFMTSMTCMASSRVGVRMRAVLVRLLMRWLISGRPKAAVFPVPVWAEPRMSWPWRARGMDCSWMGVRAV